MKVLGIDPGLATVGIGIIEKSETRDPSTRAELGAGHRPQSEGLRLIDWCTIETSPALAGAERLCELAEDLGKILEEHRPALAVVEKLYFETNRKTAMQVAEARGVILFTLHRACSGSGRVPLPILEPTPLELKLAVTGDGQADKGQLRKMLTQILRVSDATFAGGKDDATDAVALAVYGALTCHAERRRSMIGA